MEGAAVSNGSSIALTAKDGAYRLRVDTRRHSHVFVTVPCGWDSVGSFYRTAADWLAGERDFVLRSRSRFAANVHFTVVADLHYGYPGTPGNSARWLAMELGRIGQLSPASQFLVVAGDLSETGSIEQLTAIRKIFDGLDSPVFPMFGNHDGGGAPKAESAEVWPWLGNYPQVIGPAWYSFERGCCHFTILANFERYFSDEARRQQRRWLMADLRLARQRGLVPVVVGHCPPSGEVLREYDRLGVRLFIHGHWHCLRHYRIGQMDIMGIPSATFGGIDMTPRGQLDVRISPGGSLRFKYLPLGPIFKPRPTKPKTEILWRRKLADYFHVNGPALADGRVFVTANRDRSGGKSSIFCLDAASGQIIWRSVIGLAVKHTPVLWKDRVYATTQTGRLHCLAQDDGRCLWSRLLAENPHRWINNAPALTGDSVVVAGTLRGGLSGFDCCNGKQLWEIKSQVAQGTIITRDVWPWKAGPVAFGKTVLVPRHSVGLVCLDSLSGRVKWQYEYPYSYYMPGPLLCGDTVWCPSAQPNEPSVQLDARDGKCLGRARFGGVPISWTANDESIFVTVLDRWVGGGGFLQRRSAKSGKLIWQQGLPPDPADAYHYLRNGPGCLAEPVVADNVVYQSCTDGYLRLFGAEAGRPIRKISLGSPLFAGPVLGHNRMWLTPWSGEICCLRR